ncbi:MAG: hypothetical protein JNK82_19680 [Myxococcaceae bacterium]|nr:hypothetical protein [Myxococcaceae bacterium]
MVRATVARGTSREERQTGMMGGMTMAKIAITIPQDTLKKARGAIRRSRSSLSAYISTAVEDRVQADDLDSLLDEMDREAGRTPMTQRERKQATSDLYGPRKRKRS